MRALEDCYLHLGGVAAGSIDLLSPERKTAIKINLFEEEAINCLVVGRYWDLPRWAIEAYGWRFVRLRASGFGPADRSDGSL